MSSTIGQPRNRRYIYTWYYSRESRRCAGEKLEHQNEYKRAAAAVRVRTICTQARLIFTNPGSMEESCEYGLPRGTCFVSRRLELVAVAGRLWISWCVLGGADFFRFDFFSIYSSFFERTRPTASTSSTLPHVPL